MYVGSINIRSIAAGLLSQIPPLFRALRPNHHGGGTLDARYCRGVWRGHWAMLQRQGIRALPETILELGPGFSIGAGLTGLLDGAKRAWALDAFPFNNVDGTLAVLNDLIALADQAGEPVPDASEKAVLEADIRALGQGRAGTRLRYIAPWTDASVVPAGTVDFVFSQAVLEHVADPLTIYESCATWLRPGGWMCHVVDLSSHAITEDWNGHWALSDPLWAVIKGRHPDLINRYTASQHVAFAQRAGFTIVEAVRVETEDGIASDRVAKRFKPLPDDDFRCRGLTLLARKG